MSVRCPGLGASSAAARFFVQLSRSSWAQRPAAAGPLVLDVLLPSSSSAQSSPTPRPAFRPLTTVAAAARPGLRRAAHAYPPPAPARRAAFSTTSARRRTLAIHNPQKDDEGNDMTMEITPRAAERLSKIMAKDANPHLALRIQVESGGCHGFQYLMSLTTLPASFGAPTTTDGGHDEADAAPSTTTSLAGSEPGVGEDDTVFAYAKDDETESGAGEQPSTLATAAGAPKIVMDGPSLELLKGSKVDFTMELIGSQFKIVDNPLATSSCGCGTSFDIKM